MTRPSPPSLTGNVLRALGGQVAPALAALVTLPVLLRGFGADGLGILHLTWAIVGYFGLLDGGLGRALTQAVAARLARRDPDGVGGLVYSGCAALAALGLAAAIVFATASGPIASVLFRADDPLHDDAVRAFRIIALALPLVTVASGARGVLEAQQRFDLVNMVRVPMGILIYAGPALTLLLRPSILAAVAATVAARAAGTVALVWLVWRHTPSPPGTYRWSAAALRGLLGSASWMTAANLIGTATQYADRAALGALVSMSAVAYYSTPLDLVYRLTLLPAALTAVLFPVFSAEHAVRGERLQELAMRSVACTLLAVLPPVLVIVALAPELLTWWMGAEFAAAAVTATRLIAAGTLANSLAQTPFSVLQATGWARATAWVAAIELPVYVALLWGLTTAWGVNGVATAWAIRMVVDAAIHVVLARRAGAAGEPRHDRALGLATLAGGVGLLLVALPGRPVIRGALAIAVAALCAVPLAKVADLRRLRQLIGFASRHEP